MRSKTWDLVGWIFGVIFIVAGFGTVIGGSFEGLIAGILIASSGAFLLPPVQKKAAKKDARLAARTPYVILSLILLVVGTSIAPKPNKSTGSQSVGQPEVESSNQTTDKYKPSQKELAALDFLLADDAKSFATGRPSTMDAYANLQKVSAKEVADAYEKNEVKADSSHKGKMLFVSATIDNIQSGLGDEPFLTLKGSSNMFLSPQAHFEDAKEQVGKIGELSKGDQVFLVCKGGGEIGGTAFFKDCQFASDYAMSLQTDLKQNVLKLFAQGADSTTDKGVLAVAAGSIAIGRLMPDNSPCLSGKNEECSNQLEKVMGNKKDFESSLDLVITEMKAKAVIPQDFKLK